MNWTAYLAYHTGLRTRRSLLLVSCLLVSGALLSHKLLSPPSVQASAQTDHAPSGWLLTGSKPADYRTGVDKQVVHDGQPSAYLVSTLPTTDGFGTLMQSISAANYAGKRVRLRASVQSQEVLGWAGVWMRVDANHTILSFDNMQDRPIKGTQPWRSYDVVLDVPANATMISFGVLLTGSGEVWANHVSLEPVGTDTEVSSPAVRQAPLSATPVNLNFTE